MREKILIAEDNADLRELLQEQLEDAGYEVIAACDVSEALAGIKREHEMIDLLITDVQMPGVKGDELLAAMRNGRAESPVIVITGYGSVGEAVTMVKNGAFQYLTKPFEPGDLLKVVADALAKTVSHREQARMRRELPKMPPRMVGASRLMRELFEAISVTAPSKSTVLITGESGTGKELVARAVHEASKRVGLFVPVNCSAIPADLIESELFGHTGQAFTGAKQARPGLFEAADKGTLFLDEIGELPLTVQPKLLRVLQDNVIRRVGSNTELQIDVRVIAATNRDLEKRVSEGLFREDLFWRLNVIHLVVPSLRERAVDIPLLVEHFIAKTCKSLGKTALEVSPEALAVLTAYPWAGNIRELENAIERAVTFASGSVLNIEHLPERIRTSGGVAALILHSSEQNMTLRELEREYIITVLQRTKGSKKRAAEILGLDRKTLYRKLVEYQKEGNPIDL